MHACVDPSDGVKCDGAKPTCKRCTLSRRPCLWKKKVLDIHFENQYASGQVRRPRGPRPALPGAGEPVSSRHPEGDTIPAPLQLSLQVQAVTFYLNHYMQPLPSDALDVTKTLDDYICRIAAESPSALLDAAIRCMALETYSRVRGGGDVRASAEAAHYHQALLSLARRSVALLGPDNLDECLLGVFFLSRFDASTHGQADLWRKLRASPAHHYGGAMAILQHWRDHLRDDGRACHGSDGCSPIVKESRRGLLRYLLMHGLEVPGWMKDGEGFGEAGLELVHDRVTVRIADLRHRVLRLFGPTKTPSQPGESFSQAMLGMKKEVQELDRMLQDWARQFQLSWAYQQHTLKPSIEPKRTRHLPSSKVYTYSKLSYAVLWAKYAAVRLLVNDAHLKILSLCDGGLGVADPVMTDRCRLVVEQMTDIIVCSNAFIAGELRVVSAPMDGNKLVYDEGSDACQTRFKHATWPLQVACSLDSVGMSQRLWCREQLHRAGRLAGIKLFEEYQPDQSFRLDENHLAPGDG
ncbi:hypothetical protein PG985_006388 [Apiospora marii]|uniref:uncharacterized protein n=1 Tax=Apiospora marii TaxID=335849 RepID=UPI0031318846